MTCKELIEFLAKHPPNTPVTVIDDAWHREPDPWLEMPQKMGAGIDYPQVPTVRL